MLIIGLIIQVTTVLLDGINAELGRVDLLSSQVVVLKLAVNSTLLLAISILNPDALDISAFDDVIPDIVRFADMGLRGREEVGLAHGLGEEHGNLIPDSLRLSGHALERVGHRLQWRLVGVNNGGLL